MNGNDYSGAELAGRDFSGADLRGATFVGANLTKANFAQARLENADLSEARLLGANFVGAQLAGAKFCRAKLVGASFDPGALETLDTSGAALPDAANAEPVVSPFLSPCQCLAWSGEGALLFVGRHDGGIDVWDARSAQLIRTWNDPASRRSVTAIAFAPGRRLLATGGFDTVVRLWSVPEGRVVVTLTGHTQSIERLVFLPGETALASSSEDGTIRIWDLALGQEEQVLRGHSGGVRCVAVHPGGTQLASVSRDGTVRLWERAAGRLLHTLDTPRECGHAVAFSPDGDTLASGSCDGPLRFWDTRTGAALRTQEAGPILSLEYHREGKLVAAGGERTASLLHAADGSLARQLDGIHFLARNVAFDPTGQYLAESGEAGCRVWETQTGKLRQCLTGHRGGALDHGLATNAVGTTLAVRCGDSVLSFWDVQRGREIRRLHGPKLIRHVAFSEDQQTFATVDGDSMLKLWGAAGNGDLRWSRAHCGIEEQSGAGRFPQRLVLHSPRSWLVLTTQHGVTVYSLVNGRLLHRFRDQRYQSFETVALDGMGEWIAAGATNGRFVLWNTARGTRLRSRHAHAGGVFSVAFSPNGRLLATSGRDKRIQLWEVPSGRLLRVLEGHEQSINRVVFNPTGNLLASASDDHTVRLWEVSSGQLVRTLTSPGLMGEVVFAAAGRLLIASSGDHGLRLWQTETGRPLAQLSSLADGWICSTPMGRYRCSGSLGRQFWHVIGLCRFELGELDEFMPHLRLAPEELLEDA